MAYKYSVVTTTTTVKTTQSFDYHQNITHKQPLTILINVIIIVCAGVNVVNLVWNPGFPGLFAVCLSSGSVIVMELTDTAVKTIATLPQNLKASASK